MAATDKRVAMASRDPVKFAVLMAQLGLLFGAFHFFDIEEEAFENLALLLLGGFAIHYWLPFKWKETFYIVWIARGTLQLMLYRLVYHWKGPSNAPD